MITQNEVNRVAALVEKWQITDPVRQYVKMGEEIAEYLEAHSGEEEKEMGDVIFTLIAICIQLGIDFMKLYEEENKGPFEHHELHVWLYDVAITHLEIGGKILKGMDCKRKISNLLRLLLDECAAVGLLHDQALSKVLLKNETKTGKTVNGTFIKTQDL